MINNTKLGLLLVLLSVMSYYTQSQDVPEGCAQFLKIESYGFNEGNNFVFSLNGETIEYDVTTQSIRNFFRGMCVYQTNEYGDSLYQQCFDTWNSGGESDRLRDYLANLPDGSQVAFAVKDEASKSLKDDAKAEMKKFGFPADWTFDNSQYNRGSLAAFGVKGADAGSALLAMDTDGAGGSQVSTCLAYAGDCSSQLVVESYGFNDGNTFVFNTNGQSVQFNVETDSIRNFFRGFCVFQTNEQLEPLYQQCFDTWNSGDESDRLRDFLAGLADGSLVAFAVKDEGSNSLKDDAKAEIKNFGFPDDWTFSSSQYYRGSLAAIGYKGSEAGSAQLAMNTDRAGGSQVSQCFAEFSAWEYPGYEPPVVEPIPPVVEPTEPFTSECVVVFSECNFTGDSVEICDENTNIPLSEIKSVFVPADSTFYFYNAQNYEGSEAVLTSSVECYDSSSQFFALLAKGHSKSFLHKHSRRYLKGNKHQQRNKQNQRQSKVQQLSGLLKKN